MEEKYDRSMEEVKIERKRNKTPLKGRRAKGFH